jgi:hypothetical protein
VFLITICLINYLIDPYRYRNKRLKYINDAVIEAFYSEAPVLNIFNYQNKYNDAAFYIIGTSHILRGISNCNNQNVIKLGVSSLSFEESIQIANKILEASRSPKKIFIEISGKQTVLSPRHRSLFRKLFSLRTTIHSLKTFQSSILNHNNLINTSDLCNPYIPEEQKLKNINEVEKTSKSTLQFLTLNDYNHIEKTARFNKQKNNFKHQIVFFISPIPFERIERKKFKELNKQNSRNLRKVINSIKTNNNTIEFSFVNIIDTEIGWEYQFRYNNFYEGWYDGDHFKPIIGKQIMTYLISQSTHSGK